jgi:GNAT superfamily N-acetyltransferase
MKMHLGDSSRTDANRDVCPRQLTDSHLAGVVEASLAAPLRLLGHLPDVQLHDDSDAVWVVSSTPGQENAVTCVRFRKENADQRIEEILSEYRKQSVVCSWWIGPDAKPADLEGRLQKHGLRNRRRLVGMTFDLRLLTHPSRMAGGLSIRAVRDSSIFDSLEHPYFGRSDFPSRRTRIDTRISLSQLAPRRFWHFVAFQGSMPVGAATLCLAKRVAGIYDVGVVKMFRRKGVGRALIVSLLTFAHKRGSVLAVVQATKSATAFYREVGFREVCLIGVYTLGHTIGHPVKADATH